MNPLWHHTPIWWYHNHYINDIISIICDITHTVFMTTQRLYLTFHPLCLTSQPLYQCRHTCCIDDITTSMEVITLGIVHILHEITLTIYDINAQDLWYHNHYIWHRIHAISVITFTLLMISHQLYLRDLIHYIWWHHIHCIQQHIHYICNITATVSVSHTHSFHDMTPFVCMTLQPLYV